MGDLCKSSIFFSDQHLCNADILPPPEVRARIEVSVLNFLRTLSSPTPAISDLPLINRKSSNSRVSQGLLTDVSWIFLSRSFCTRSIGQSKVKEFHLIDLLMSVDPNHVKRSVLIPNVCALHAFVCQTDVVALLRCSRFSLGIIASSRGTVAGRLEPNQEVVDCTACGSSGYAISGDLNLLEKLVLKTDARYIFVVEKHAIFQRMAEDRVFNQIPSILITGKGYPDIATRFLLHRLSQAFPKIQILGIVDWNPAGLAIFCTYKYGSIAMGLEAYRYGAFLYFHHAFQLIFVQLIPEESFAPLKPRDLQIAKSLTASEILPDKYKEELAVMVESGHRAEIEALYYHGYSFLGKYLANKIVQACYI
ncbi:hypothetical protein RJ639_026172 [Escallonia herrerae]|uniref:Topoisomerase 6 subunit A/Spo11 TOPRIM domain-containing protein n=1 Tax=Escallonia herrerae TaxID=1293975 RepID=A0AA88UW72_9ASTE|nr:hypothetical protein RJ639_026172 [Escallonia herrerae]